MTSDFDWFKFVAELKPSEAFSSKETFKMNKKYSCSLSNASDLHYIEKVKGYLRATCFTHTLQGRLHASGLAALHDGMGVRTGCSVGRRSRTPQRLDQWREALRASRLGLTVRGARPASCPSSASRQSPPSASAGTGANAFRN